MRLKVTNRIYKNWGKVENSNRFIFHLHIPEGREVIRRGRSPY